MNRKIVFSLVFMLLIIPALSAIEIDYTKDHKEIVTIEENPLKVSLEPGFLSRGVKLLFSNTGDTSLTNIEWCFSTKPVITAIIGKGDVCSQTIDELGPGEEITIILRPFLGDIPSPRGFGRVYMKVQAKADETEMVRDQKQSFLLFCFLYKTKDTYVDIQPNEAYNYYLNETFDLIIDVVGLDIYSLGHLPGAVNYIWADGTLAEMIPTLDVNGTYLVYCHTDPPSTDSAQALVDAGIESVYRLEGNYRAWVEAGYPIET